MILGEKDGIVKTFDSKQLFDAAKSIDPGLTLVQSEYKQNYSFEDIEVKVITPKGVKEIEPKVLTFDDEPELIQSEFNTSDFTGIQFETQINDFTIEQLKLFANDSRRTISKKAIKKIQEISKTY
jgi:NADH dehydrogenase FAD-containing subunit